MHKTRDLATALATVLLVAGGCSTTGTFGREKLAVASGVKYVGGRGYGMYPSTPNIADNVRNAMTDLGIGSIHQVPEANGILTLEGQTADKRPARVTIQTTGIRSTVALKVGWLGDEPFTRSFLDRVEARQGALPASAYPVEADPDQPAPGARFSRSAVPDSVMTRGVFEPSSGP